MALLSTVAVSPRSTPTHTMAAPANSKPTCAIVFFDCGNLLKMCIRDSSRIDLTTVDQPKRDMAVQAVDMLRDKIENGTQGYVHQILLPTLIQRGTCRKLDPSK